MDKNDYEQYYTADYYNNYGNNENYENRDYWTPVFKNIAKKLVQIYNPKTFLDVGCAYGYLVEAMRDLGVEAYGVDVSSHAISKVRDDIKPFCFVCNVVEGLPNALPEYFDCISTIEVIEHLYEDDAQKFINAICTHTNNIIFSSSPDDITDPVHFNVQQPEYWVKRFAMEGFLHELNTDVTFISNQALTFKRQTKDTIRLIEDYEHAFRLQAHKIKSNFENILNDKENHIKNITENINISNQENEKLKSQLNILNQENEKLKSDINTLNNQYNSLVEEMSHLQNTLTSIKHHETQLETSYNQILNTFSWKITKPIRKLRSLFR